MIPNEYPTQSMPPLVTSGAMARPATAFQAGTVLADRFRITGLLGHGGMGEVYRAEDLTLGQSVALKFLPEPLEGHPAHLARLLDEVRAARQVTHPNVCRVHDIMEAQGRRFLSMELIDGEDLASLLHRVGRLNQEKGLQIARQITAALAAIHARGILHRDLKPANVMIDGRGDVRLADFGLAVAAEGVAQAGQAGTPAYMAAELLSGSPASAQSDLYALGLVLHEVFTGKRAFQGGTPEELLNHHRDLDPALTQAIQACLAKDPAERPASALALLGRLPGGDPLAELVAAGETPTPRMVADAGGVGTLRPIVAWCCLGLLAVLMPLAIWAMDRASLLRHVNLAKPPEVLAERARQVLAKLGHDAPIVDEAWWFQYVPAAHRAALHDPSAARLASLSEARPPVVEFHYRAAAEPLAPLNAYGLVGFSDPAPIRVGMVSVRLDPSGRLLHYRAVPLSRVGETPRPMDWSAVLAEAGLDPRQLQPTVPSVYPAVHATSLASWTQGSLRFEAAERNGRLVGFTTVGADSGFRHGSMRGWAFAILFAFFYLGMPGLSLILAYRNWRKGRIDLVGANRLGGLVLACWLLNGILDAHHTGRFDLELVVWIGVMRQALFFALVVWLGYLGMEPFVRRRWPDALIAWSRVLAGRVRDPRLGRDLLIGLACGWAAVLLLALGRLTGAQPFASTFLPATHLAEAFGVVITNLAEAIFYALLVGVLLTFLRTLTRRMWLATPILTLVASGLGVAAFRHANPIPADYLVCGLIGLISFALLSRAGLFALMAFFLPVVGAAMPLVADLTSWQASVTLGRIALTTALGVFGFLTSVGSQPLFGAADEA